MNARVRTAAVLVGIMLVLATAWQVRAVRLSGGASTPTVQASSPRARDVAAEGRVTAYPGAEVKVSAEREGRLLTVRVTEGQTVRRGEVLAEVEAQELLASIREARARLTELEAERGLAELTLARRRQLAAEQVISQHDVDQAERDLETAQARRETAAATIARLDAQLEKTRVRAPIAGTVTARHVDPGETVKIGDPVVTLADLGRLRVEGEADEADEPAVTVGAPVSITSDGYPGRSWTGRVEEVGDAVTLRRLRPQDPGRPTDTRVLSVKVAFAETSPLKLGTTVELRIHAPAPAR